MLPVTPTCVKLHHGVSIHAAAAPEHFCLKLERSWFSVRIERITQVRVKVLQVGG